MIWVHPGYISSTNLANGARRVVRNGGDAWRQARANTPHVSLGNPHPHSTVKGTNRVREVSRPTLIRPPLIFRHTLTLVAHNPSYSPSYNPSYNPSYSHA